MQAAYKRRRARTCCQHELAMQPARCIQCKHGMAAAVQRCRLCIRQHQCRLQLRHRARAQPQPRNSGLGSAGERRKLGGGGSIRCRHERVAAAAERAPQARAARVDCRAAERDLDHVRCTRHKARAAAAGAAACGVQ